VLSNNKSYSFLEDTYYPKWKVEKFDRYNKSITVRMYLFQCKDLPAADDNGLSDPYISIWN